MRIILIFIVLLVLVVVAFNAGFIYCIAGMRKEYPQVYEELKLAMREKEKSNVQSDSDAD